MKQKHTKMGYLGFLGFGGVAGLLTGNLIQVPMLLFFLFFLACFRKAE